MIDTIKRIESTILGKIDTELFSNTELYELVQQKDARENFQDNLSFGTIKVDWRTVDECYNKEVNSYDPIYHALQDKCVDFVGQFIIRPQYVWYTKSGDHGIKFTVDEIISFEVPEENIDIKNKVLHESRKQSSGGCCG